MASDKTLPATDSAAELHDLIGDDSTATFEDDPKFVDSNPGGAGSSENVEEQRDTDDLEDSEEEEEEEDEDEDEDDEEDEEDEDGDDEDEDDEDAEDDADELVVAGGLRADGLLGQEDEQDDVREKRDRTQGDAARARGGDVGPKDADDDAGDVEPGVDEDELDADDMDTDQVADAHLAGLGNAGRIESHLRSA